jgi:hypothetical protein
MMLRKSTIELKNLPLRPSKISDEELSKLFGGCATSGSKFEHEMVNLHPDELCKKCCSGHCSDMGWENPSNQLDMYAYATCA